jgi:hypothetical protein
MVDLPEMIFAEFTHPLDDEGRWSTDPIEGGVAYTRSRTPSGDVVEKIYEWAWNTAAAGETSSETMKRAIEAALQGSSSLLEGE